MRNKPLKGLMQKESPLKHPHPEHPHKEKTKEPNVYSGKKSFSTAETKTGKKK